MFIAKPLQAIFLSAVPPAATSTGDEVGGSASFFLNGIDQYIVLDNPWTPESYPYSISVNTESEAYAADSVILSGDDPTAPRLAHFLTTANTVAFYEDAAGNDAFTDIVENSNAKRAWRLDCTAEGTTLTVNGVQTALGVPARTTNSTPYEFMGGGPGGSGLWPGTIKNAIYEDTGPLQGREFMVGRGFDISPRIRGDLVDKISIDTAEPFNFKWPWERQEVTGTGQASFFTFTEGEVRFTIIAYDTNHSNYPNGISYQSVGGSPQHFTDALINIPIGHKADYELDFDGTNLRLFVHGIEATASPIVLSEQSKGVCEIGHIACGSTNGNSLRGALGQLEVTCTGAAPGIPFLDWDDRLDSRVVDFAELTAPEELGNLDVMATVDDFTLDGVLMDNIDGSVGFLQWDSAWIAGSTTIPTNGFTLCFEVESGVFADDYVSQGTLDSLGFLISGVLGHGRDGLSIHSATSAWGSNSGTILSKTSNIASDGHTLYHLSVSASGAAVGYINKAPFAAGQLDNTDLTNLFSLALAGTGGFGGPHNPQFRIRRAILAEGIVDQTLAIKQVRLALTGDSLMTGLCYPSGLDTNNSPPLTGYTQGSGVYNDDNSVSSLPFSNDLDGAYQPKSESGLAWMHYYMAEKGIAPWDGTDHKIWLGSRSGSRVRNPDNNGYDGTLKERIDALLTETTDAHGAQYPPYYGDPVQWLVCDSGTNDAVAWWTANGDTPPPASWAEQIVTDTLAEMDRVINAGIERIIYLSGTKLWLNGPAGQPHSTTRKAQVASEALIAEQKARMPGYRGLITYVDMYATWQSGWTGSDGSHQNALGRRKTAELIVSGMPNYNLIGEQQFIYPLERISGSDNLSLNTANETLGGHNIVWQANNWVYYPTRSRRYKGNEGSGATLKDARHPDDAFYNATIINPGSGEGWG